MKREKFTEKLVRIIQTIESGAVPAKVQEFYVFGSYARGALEPGDLDILVVHDDPGRKYWDALEQEGLSRREMFTRFETQMRKTLRRPGEPIDIVLVQSFDHFIHHGSAVPRDEVLLLWSDADRDWRPKLEAIRPDPTAGRAEREMLFPIRRLACDLPTMKEVMAMIADGRLTFTRIPIGSIACPLTSDHQVWLDRHNQGGRSKFSEVVPYALQWLQTHRQGLKQVEGNVMCSRLLTHRVEVGRPSLRRMVYQFTVHEKVQRQCLIPYFKKAGPNELLVFERGPNWGEAKSKRVPAETL